VVKKQNASALKSIIVVMHTSSKEGKFGDDGGVVH
jgi:hypothetical protein